MEKASKLLALLNELFYPQESCNICEGPLYRVNNSRTVFPGVGICSHCQEKLEIPSAPYCNHCHKPLNLFNITKGAEQELLCEDCRLTYGDLEISRSAVIYNNFMQQTLALYKYRGKESLAKSFSRLLKIAYDANYAKTKIDFITYIPLHEIRLKERGFNQAEQLARLLGEFIGKPLFPLLKRVKNTDKQSKHTKQERIKQIQDSFVINQEFLTRVQNSSVLIIDDIYTTGSTMLEAGRIIKSHGVKAVYSLTLCRATAQLDDDKEELFV